jgi:hypothetical protein
MVARNRDQEVPEMERPEFEERFLALVNQTDVTITAANIAYHLKLPIETVQEHLLALELDGVLRQQTDKEGNAYYEMPKRAAPGTLPAALAGEAPEGSAGAKPGVHDPATLPAAPIYGGPSAAPAKGRNINGLVLNVLIPGLGSLICGRKEWIWLFALLLLGFVLLFGASGWARLWGVLPLVGAWIWSLIAGVALLNERE